MCGTKFNNAVPQPFDFILPVASSPDLEIVKPAQAHKEFNSFLCGLAYWERGLKESVTS